MMIVPVPQNVSMCEDNPKSHKYLPTIVVYMSIVPDPNISSDYDTMHLIHHSEEHISPYR
jgi:hypothetical protein